MGSSIENLKADFLRILEEIEAVTGNVTTYEPSKYESCIKIKGQAILPPLMTPEKVNQCLKWKQEAQKVEENLAQKRRDKYLAAVNALKQEQSPRSKESDEKARPLFLSLTSRTISAPPSTLDSILSTDLTELPPLSFREDTEENLKKRERRLSYTLDEPSPVLLAYMQRFRDDDQCEPEVASKDEVEETDTKTDEQCQDPQCQLETYLADLAQPPDVTSVRNTPLPPKVSKEVQQPVPNSPDKENVPPIAKTPDKSVITKDCNNGPLKEIQQHEWATQPTIQPPSPLKIDDAPTWAKNEAVSGEVIESTPRSEIGTALPSLDTSIGESITLPTALQKPSTTPPNQRGQSQRQIIEAAVSTLAMHQQQEIRRLMEQQAKDREQLKMMFEEQQRALVASVLSAVSRADVNTDDTGVMADLESLDTERTLTSQQSIIFQPVKLDRSKSPVIPTVKPKIDPDSLILPPDYHMPEDAKTPTNNLRFERLSALIKGHLTRRLLKTGKVQQIITSMKDIMSIALQLHREGQQYSRLEDVQLHSRLLQQLQRESHSFHDIFFKYAPRQKMNIIRLDRELIADKEARGENQQKKKRISAVTMAKLQQKQKIQVMLAAKSRYSSEDSSSAMLAANLYISPNRRKIFKSTGRNSPRTNSRGKFDLFSNLITALL
jgi:hypothetical protein